MQSHVEKGYGQKHRDSCRQARRTQRTRNQSYLSYLDLLRNTFYIKFSSRVKS